MVRKDLVELNYVLDLNVIFAVVVGGILSIVIPIFWQMSQHAFENKVTTINQLHSIFQKQSQPISSIESLIRKKFFIQDITKPMDQQMNYLKARKKPLDIPVKEDFDKFNFQDGGIVGGEQAHIILFSTNEINKLKEKRNSLLGEILTNYRNICYSDDESITNEIGDIMNNCKEKKSEIHDIESQMFQLFADVFSWHSKLKKKCT